MSTNKEEDAEDGRKEEEEEEGRKIKRVNTLVETKITLFHRGLFSPSSTLVLKLTTVTLMIWKRLLA